MIYLTLHVSMRINFVQILYSIFLKLKWFPLARFYEARHV